jgi:hypothetical protein
MRIHATRLTSSLLAIRPSATQRVATVLPLLGLYQERDGL